MTPLMIPQAAVNRVVVGESRQAQAMGNGRNEGELRWNEKLSTPAAGRVHALSPREAVYTLRGQ